LIVKDGLLGGSLEGQVVYQTVGTHYVRAPFDVSLFQTNVLKAPDLKNLVTTVLLGTSRI